MFVLPVAGAHPGRHLVAARGSWGPPTFPAGKRDSQRRLAHLPSRVWIVMLLALRAFKGHNYTEDSVTFH
jgi:hypothetical protein